MLDLIHKIIVYLIVVYAMISFSAGLPPFDFNILEKEFYPSNDILKYLIVSVLLLVMILIFGVSTYKLVQPDDVRVLLSKA